MYIKINGQEIETKFRYVYELCGNISAEKVIILNGYQTSGDYELSEGDELFIIQKGVIPGQEQLEGMMAARHTPRVHARVKAAGVAIAGLGGLGSNVAVMLARTGVGNLLLVDFDVVEPSNLNRQSYYISHLGLPKTIALEKQLKEINPFINIKIKNVRVTEENAEELFAGYDVICEAFDNPEAKAVLVNTVLERLHNIKVVAASGMAGYHSSNLIRTERKMKNLYVCGDFENEAGTGSGLMAPRVQICAAHQANMVLRLLLGIEEA
ncbi:sulfur carrier protein ThiS adenylyltransferase [Ruminiclostridium sufflavum DSM 19573]|uniref:Sulfur carrier protein ThiS adenylyltransferase n=1 Tax=Ruminiclostridium sufflavum DSM 19573 TaxID=1121337 RepID=A0A318XLY4_9FIRM|nr:sulfur carrier protein ThiS adenylyltransferase ThiF [Ruminiclostridium sufflavum]PYG88732.1 sulfur carrier protein ThiS adenylyltransferase [Ruminiclostridium sufflavum DSM 19573]